MSNPKASEDPESSPVRPPGRLRGALQVLRGEALVPDQIRCEWIEYQVTFSGILDRFGALLARQAKAEKRRLDEMLAEAPPPPDVAGAASGDARKAELRARAAELHFGRRGGKPPQSPPNLPIGHTLPIADISEEPT